MLTIAPTPIVDDHGIHYQDGKEPYFVTSKFWLPRLPEDVSYMHVIAKDLSLATGRRVEFVDLRDSESSAWGDFGCFRIK